jgi:universal stress protein E
MRLLVASDLSHRSERALWRAASLAQQQKAPLTVLHVVDESLPFTLQESLITQTKQTLQQQLNSVIQDPALAVESVVKIGNPFQTIVQEAQLRQINWLILGAHRRRVLKEMFTGTTVERVIRHSDCPVLMVNTEPAGRYEKILLALDLSELTVPVLRQSQALGVFQEAELTIVHAFTPLAKGSMHYAGVDAGIIEEHVAHAQQEALRELNLILRTEEFKALNPTLVVEEGTPFQIIKQETKKRSPQLLIFGTHGYSGIKRLLLGSVAEQLLRELECDMLIIPPAKDIARA